MTYAIDTNIIYDILLADPVFGPLSRDFVMECASRGDVLVACDAVWAEASAGFPDKDAFSRSMSLLGIEYSPIPKAAATRAGALWCEARNEAERKGVSKRFAIVPDFLVGAHAEVCADALVTRDRGFTRKYFSSLRVIDPSNC